MAGSGVLALPRAVVDSGKWFRIFIEDQEIILMMKASRRSCVGTSLTTQPWFAFFMHG